MEFVTQGKHGVQVWSTADLRGEGSREPIVTLPPVLDAPDRAYPTAHWSPDRSHLALLGLDGCVRLHDARKPGYPVAVTVPSGRPAAVRYFTFSPQGSYLITWERYDASAKEKEKEEKEKEEKEEDPASPMNEPDAPGKENLMVWNASTGEQLAAFVMKQLRVGVLQWSADEATFYRRVTNGIDVFPGRAKGKKIRTVRVEDVAEFSVSPAGRSIAFFIPEKKGRPASIRVVSQDSPDQPLAQKTFYQSQEVKMVWSPRGDALCVVASCATDQMNQTYYGSSALYFLRVGGKGEAVCLVPPEKGPVHDVQWSPLGTGFMVLYGAMPATAELYDERGEREMVYGTTRRNTVLWDPFGKVCALGGFGNLPGEMDVWERGQTRPLSSFTASCSVEHAWAPDGVCFLSAVCAPRMRVDNKVTGFNYDGSVLFEVPVELLTHAEWRPVKPGSFSPQKLMPKPGAGAAPKQNQKYVAGKGLGKGGALAAMMRQEKQGETFVQATRVQKLPPGMAAEDDGKAKTAGGPPSRNERKRAAKERAKEAEAAPPAAAAYTKDAASTTSQDVPPKQLGAAPGAAAVAAADATEDAAKKVKRLQKKIKQIEDLQAKAAKGMALDADQKEKLASLPAARTELAEAERLAGGAAPPLTSASPPPVTGAYPNTAAGEAKDTEDDPAKKKKKIEKKLKQIEDLKKKAKSELDSDQLAKLASEAELRAELAAQG